MGRVRVVLVAAALLAAAPALAQPKDPLPQRNDSIESAITSPAEDLNLKRTEMPEVLNRAEADPYQLANTETCSAIASEIAQLDEALGVDRDAPQPVGGEQEKAAAAAVRTGVQAFVPFRGVVRWISGAARHEERLEAAINAGAARRGFLKGKALGMNCPPPASPAWFAPRPAAAPEVQIAAAPAGPSGDPVVPDADRGVIASAPSPRIEAPVLEQEADHPAAN